MARKISSSTRKTSKQPKQQDPRTVKKAGSPKLKQAHRTRKKTTRSSNIVSRRGELSRGWNPPVFNPRTIPIDRWLDILGVLILLVGVITLLSMNSQLNSTITEGWSSFIGESFGWGRYLIPMVLIFGGTWMVLRRFERIPRINAGQVIGAGLLFTSVLGLAHFISLLRNDLNPATNTSPSTGGGNAGATISNGLTGALGVSGALITLFALFLIGVALVLNISIAEMIRRVLSFSWRILEKPVDALDRIGLKLRGKNLSNWEDFPHQFESGEKQVAKHNSDGQLSPESIHLDEIESAEDKKPHIWVLPPIKDILEKGGDVYRDEGLDLQRARVIEETLGSFGAPGRVVEINRGPTITQFGVEPDFIETRTGRMRVRVSKISSLVDDLALALSARRIRIQAPVPGKGFVGIEVPNDEISMVTLRDILESDAFRRLKTPLRFALGKNVSGYAVAADLSAMPHLLIAGATGSGKSVCVNALICCLLMNNTPDQLRMIMVDPKRVELAGYNGVPHLLAPVVVELEKVVTVLQWVTREMDMRYHKLAEEGCRSIQDYNASQAAHGRPKLPYLVVIIDELADLMMIAPDETERTITRLAQLARATGIHLIISTQRPSVDVLTGLIKANFPARIAFAVASGIDSRVILDQPGAERLLGQGDMLFQAPDAPAPVRLQGVFVSDIEIQLLVNFWQEASLTAPILETTTGGIPDASISKLPLKQITMWDDIKAEENQDPLFDEAVDLCRRQGRASISMLQRRLRIGYTRAARLVETMEEKGIVGPPGAGTGTREILDYGQAAPPADEAE